MKPVLLIFFIVIVATAPTTLGQSIYKCPGPDGLSYYQQTPCPQGAPMTIQDNGKESGDQPRGLREEECEWLRDYGGRVSAVCANTVQEELPAETSGLREGERRWLRAIRQRHADSNVARRNERPTRGRTRVARSYPPARGGCATELWASVAS